MSAKLAPKENSTRIFKISKRTLIKIPIKPYKWQKNFGDQNQSTTTYTIRLDDSVPFRDGKNRNRFGRLKLHAQLKQTLFMFV